ncbi:MAG: response regulator [Bacteriovoracaceae bacterium]|nr:response regulator [Bacteriovoracaceae bacterium]
MKNSSIKLNDLVNQTPSCLKIIDCQGRLIHMNEKGLSLIEADNMQSVFLAEVYSIVHPDDQEKFIEFNKKICSGDTGRLIFKIVGLKGTIRCVETYASPIELDDGSIGHIAITNDITAIEKVRNLNHSISLLRESYFKNLENPQVIFNCILDELIKITGSEYGFIGDIKRDSSGLFLRTYAITDISWNDETRQFYEKYKLEGIEFRNLKTLFGEVMLSNKTLLTNDPKNHPASGGLPPGHPDLNSFLGVPLFYGKEMIAMFGLANCPGGFQESIIEELRPYFEATAEIVANFQLNRSNKRKEQLLLTTTERLELALEGSKLGIWDWDLRDDTVQFDKRWGEMIGIPFEELEMNLDTWKSRVHPDDLEKCHQDITHYLEGKTDQYINIHRMKHSAGHWVYIMDQGKVSQFDSFGKPIRFTGSHLDISYQKDQENQIVEARNKAILAERSKDEFLATMSHEIRTPLNGVLGMVELLKDTTLNPEQEEMLQTIESSGDALMSLLSDILDISKINSGKMVLEFKDFSLEKLLSDTTSLMKFKALEKNIDLKIKDLTKAPLLLNGDIVRIKQVLINLISNSIKFTSEGYVELEADYSEGNIYFTVSDTGIGISTKNQQRLFDEFVQADSSTTRVFGGTGLGLSICKKIINLMKGEISLKSEEGLGTKIKVSIPIKQRISPVGNLINESTSLMKEHTILVVEDNSTNLIIICRLLEKHGQKILTATNGQEAIDIFDNKHEEIDLIFMDMQMPILDGLESTREIRKKSYGKKVPIVALTANVFDSDRDNCFSVGMNDFLGKPIQRKLLHEILLKYLE